MTGAPSDRARERRITELMHFTTSKGLIGILAAGKVLSRQRLNADDYLENIKVLNSPDRSRDADWLDWVNLSISRVNSRFLGASKSWHADDGIWWACLSFDVAILDHEGVYFCTGNNAYPRTVRGQGGDGFDALFAPTVKWGRYNSVHTRSSAHLAHLPTDPQAEVLYPGELALSYLRAIYVPEPELTDTLAGILAGVGWADAIHFEARPEVFE